MKLVIVFRKDIFMSPPKMAVQAAHAAVECVLMSEKDKVERWREEGAKKVILEVEDLPKLLDVYNRAKKEGLVAVLIADAGRTELPPGTITCVGIGPDDDKKIDKITGNLKLYKWNFRSGGT